MADGLLGFLGNLGQGLLEGIGKTGAAYAASQGQPALLQMIQEQERQQNLLNNLKQMSQQELEGPFGQTIQRQLQFGDVAGAQKTLANLPMYKQAQEVFKNPKLGLDPAEQESLQLFASISPEAAVKLGTQLKARKAVTEGQLQVSTKAEEQRIAREKRQMEREKAKTPGAVISSAILSGSLTPENADKALPGLLRRSGINVPTKPDERQIFLQDILSDPTLQLVPQQQKQGIFERLFSAKPNAPTAQPAAPTQPTAPAQGKRLYSPSAKKYFIQMPDGSIIPE